ncbi:MAG: acetolactate synthase small subunit [Saprospiraceae bacterium]
MESYTITIYTEHKIGILTRVVSVFTRRHINIESITASESSLKGVYRFTIVVKINEETVQKVVLQLEKAVDILKAFYYDDSQIIYQEIALYKVPTKAFTKKNQVEKIIRTHHARILEIEADYTVIEKTGHQQETEALLSDLQEIGVYEFVRSGRVAIVKPMESLNKYLQSLAKKP